MKKLIEQLIGKKYYMILCFDGIQDFITSTPFCTKGEAKEFIASQSCCKTIRSTKILSFRTREKIILVTDRLH